MENLICITGPMAAGKNELSLMLEKCGWLHIDADVLAHFAIDNCKEEILATFSSYAKEKNINLLNEDGYINRKELGKLLFSDPSLLQKQERRPICRWRRQCRKTCRGRQKRDVHHNQN